ncbi:MAG: hypothetical protein KJO23_05400, partial [Bacteroidia bacterium]|nr:hypothetical protein [Bacteroidia bacterium]
MKEFIRLSALALMFILISCGDKAETASTDNLFKFKEYISYNTYGIKSITSPITVELMKSLNDYELNQELPSEYLKIKPKTSGKLIIQNGRTLHFQPSEYLDPDTEYTVTVQLDKLYEDIPREFRTYTFSFKTITPNFKIDLDNLQSYSKQWQFVTGSLETSDVVALEKAKQLVKAEQDSKVLSVVWDQEDGEGKFFNFTIDSIQRPMDDTTIEISWNGKSIGSNLKGEDTFPIPGQNNFKVVDVKSVYAPQSTLSINFSDPLEEDQDFSGLVTIEKAESLRFEVDGNVLHIYPANRVIGNVRVTLFSGIRNDNGLKLKNEFSELVSLEQLKPGIE